MNERDCFPSHSISLTSRSTGLHVETLNIWYVDCYLVAWAGFRGCIQLQHMEWQSLLGLCDHQKFIVPLGGSISTVSMSLFPVKSQMVAP